MFSSPSASPSRSGLVVALLALALVLSMVLGYQAHDAARSHRAVAEKTLREHAAFAAWEYTGVLRRDLYLKLVRPGLTVGAAIGGKDPTRAFGPRAVVDSLGAAYPFPYRGELDYLFRIDLATGELESIGPLSIPAAERAWLVDSLPAHAAIAYSSEWEHASRLVETPRGPRYLAYRLYPASRPRVAYGFRTSLDTHHYLFDKVATRVPLLPPSLTNGWDTLELLSIAVTGPDGRELYASTPRYTSAFAAGDTLGAGFAGIATHVVLRPDAAATLVIGGLPGSRLPLVLGLLLLTAGLLVAAILQLRREYDLAVLRADFVSSVSHELRTPLAQIRMFAETLLLGRVRSEEERRRSLEILVKEARRLTHQVDNVLLFSRSDRGRLQLHPEPADLGEVVRSAVAAFGPIAAAADCRVELDVESGVRAEIDPVVFPQAVLNLLENAVKYGPHGQTLAVRVVTDAEGRARIEVEDEGPGVPREDRDRVWEPYHRLERDRDGAVAGSGIGLAVVREVAVSLGGHARVESARGGGARFVLELPPTEERAVPAAAVAEPVREGV